jgi:hypothetical protein
MEEGIHSCWLTHGNYLALVSLRPGGADGCDRLSRSSGVGSLLLLAAGSALIQLGYQTQRVRHFLDGSALTEVTLGPSSMILVDQMDGGMSVRGQVPWIGLVWPKRVGGGDSGRDQTQHLHPNGDGVVNLWWWQHSMGGRCR